MPEDCWRCNYCADIIGVYEPMVIVVDEEPHETSRAALGDGGLIAAGHSAHFHKHCWELRADDATEADRRA